MSTPDPPEALYRRRRDGFGAEAAALGERESRFARGRLVAFFAALGALLAALVGSTDPRPGWLAAAAGAAVAFALLVARHGRLRRRRRHAEALAAVNERALARLERAWDRLEPPPPPEGPLPPFARDLSLFGRASLAQLLDTVGTAPGRALRDRWLLEPAAPAEARRRQAAAAALAPELDFRQELEVRARAAGGDAPRLEAFYAWAEGEPWLLRRPALLWAARLLAALVPATLVGHLGGWLADPWWVPAAGAAYLLSASCARRLDEVLDRASAGGDGLAGYGELFAHLERWPAAGGGPGDPLAELGERLAPGGRPIARSMARLESLDRLADVRHGVIHFPLQVLTLWDFHLVARLEAWQREVGREVRGWLDALARAEALAALAALAHLHPEWAFPELAEGGEGDPQAVDRPAIVARDLGHPLLPPARRVDNDLELGRPGTFLLVTGSNMAGKTTFLRALGTNAVLAQAGAPVCARSLRLPPVALATSVVIEDSLEEGVSFFLAELARLKEVVDLAAAPPPGRRVLFLLDEILRGTNSAERRIAVGRVLAHLVALGAIGAVTTHDLEILATGELEAAAELVHFRETLHPRGEEDRARAAGPAGPTMSFDYRVRPGLAPTTNALALLEAVGLPGARVAGDVP